MKNIMCGIMSGADIHDAAHDLKQNSKLWE